MKYFLILLSIFFFSHCKEELVLKDLCPGCTSSAILNGFSWELDPYSCSFQSWSPPMDSLLFIELYGNAAHDNFIDALIFSGLPFRTDSISLPDTNALSDLKVYFNVYELAYDVEEDQYKVVPGSGSYVKVEVADHETLAFKISFNLVLAVNGDSTSMKYNNSYPAVLNITDGNADGILYR